MNFDLDDNQILFASSVERFCAPIDVAARHATRKLENGFNPERWREMAELGLIGLPVSETEGGLGGSQLDCAIVALELGKGLAVEPWLECGFLPAMLLAGTAHSEKVVSGEVLAAFAFAEPGRRFQLDAAAVVAKNGKISGEKTFVLGGSIANLLIVSALHNGETCLFAIDSNAAGVHITSYPIADGSFASLINFNEVPHGDPLPADLSSAIDSARIMAAAEITGITKHLFDDTLAYLKTREQFGRPIGSFQVLQHRMVDAYAKIESMQSALWRALLQPSSSAAVTKAYIAEQAIWVAEQAVQLHGGMGVTDELTIGHGLKRILLLSKLFGDQATAFAQLAKAA